MRIGQYAGHRRRITQFTSKFMSIARRSRCVLASQRCAFRPSWADENGREETWRKVGGPVAGDWAKEETPRNGATGMTLFCRFLISMICGFCYIWRGNRHVRPKKAEVSRTLRRMFRDDGGDGEILVLGDIACASCVDRRCEATWRGLREEVDSLSGGLWQVQFASFSGAKITDFLGQAENSAFYGPYDWVYVVVGWNSSALSVFGTCPIPPGRFRIFKLRHNTRVPGI